MKAKFKIGDICRVTGKTKEGPAEDHQFRKGTLVEIKICQKNDNWCGYNYHYRCDYLDGHDFWWVGETELELANEEVTKANIPLTTKAYAVVNDAGDIQAFTKSRSEARGIKRGKDMAEKIYRKDWKIVVLEATKIIT